MHRSDFLPAIISNENELPPISGTLIVAHKVSPHFHKIVPMPPQRELANPGLWAPTAVNSAAGADFLPGNLGSVKPSRYGRFHILTIFV